MKCRIKREAPQKLDKCVKNELMRQAEEWAKQYNVDMYSNILYTVRKETEKAGDAWGKERLTRLFISLFQNYDKFRRDYDFEDTYAERVKLKEECGLDVEQLMKSEGLL